MSSTLLFDAASISTTSVSEPHKIPLHISHSLHGSPSFGIRQFMALASIFAEEVFPVPLPPLKRYACPTLPDIIWFFKVLVICSCPTISENVKGLNFLYNAVYAIFFTSYLEITPVWKAKISHKYTTYRCFLPNLTRFIAFY